MKQLEDFSHKLDSCIWFITFGVNLCSLLFYHRLLTLPRREGFYKRQRNVLKGFFCFASTVLIFFIFVQVTLFFEQASRSEHFMFCSVFLNNFSWPFLIGDYLFAFCNMSMTSHVLPSLFSVPIHAEVRFLQFSFKHHIYHTYKKESQAFIYITTSWCFGFLCVLVSTNAQLLFTLGLFQLEETHCLIFILENMRYYLHISTIQNIIFQHQKSNTRVGLYSFALSVLPVSKTFCLFPSSFCLRWVWELFLFVEKNF